MSGPLTFLRRASDCSKLDAMAKSFLMGLVLHADNTTGLVGVPGYASPSCPTMAMWGGMSDKSGRLALADLETGGWVRVERHPRAPHRIFVVYDTDHACEGCRSADDRGPKRPPPKPKALRSQLPQSAVTATAVCGHSYRRSPADEDVCGHSYRSSAVTATAALRSQLPQSAVTATEISTLCSGLPSICSQIPPKPPQGGGTVQDQGPPTDPSPDRETSPPSAFPSPALPEDAPALPQEPPVLTSAVPEAVSPPSPRPEPVPLSLEPVPGPSVAKRKRANGLPVRGPLPAGWETSPEGAAAVVWARRHGLSARDVAIALESFAEHFRGPDAKRHTHYDLAWKIWIRRHKSYRPEESAPAPDRFMIGDTPIPRPVPGGQAVDAYVNGQLDAKALSFSPPTGARDLDALHAIVAHHAEGDSLAARVESVRKISAAYRRTREAAAERENGFSPERCLAWLNAGRPAAHQRASPAREPIAHQRPNAITPERRRAGIYMVSDKESSE